MFLIALDVTEDWAAVLRRASIASVLEARMAIETEAGILAAQRRTPTDLRSIRRCLGVRATTTTADLEAFVDADVALHRSIVVAAHNEVLVELFDGFVPRVHRATIEMLNLRPDPTPQASQAAHAAIVQAVADRDARLAGELTRAHLKAVKAVLS